MKKYITVRADKELKRTRRQTAVFMIPSMAGVLIFFVLPLFVVLYYSFIDNIINGEFVGFENYARLFRNTAFLTAVKNSLRFSAVAVPLAVILPMLLAMALDSGIPGSSRFRTVFITPLLVPVASVVLIWQVFFHYNGVLNDITALFGAEPVDWLKSEYSQIVIVLLFLWKNAGYNMILFMAALSGIPKDILEAATLDGAGPVQKFFRIKLRYLSSSMLFVGILSLINSFKVFREVYLLTGDYPYENLYLLQHFMNNTFEALDYQKLSSAAIIMCIFMMIVIGALMLVDKKFGGDIEE